ncbi:MAG: UV DNA damage repair endonuclease UvsE [Campylobacterales bacterium]|nr:UV DNA damage repair endonuclease UvsE [Campylobacterales bacterium]
MRFGLFCSLRDNAHSTNRTFRLASLSRERVVQTARQNLEDLPPLIDYCVRHDIGMFRLGNAIVPFASHIGFDPAWWEELEPLFETARHRIEGSGVRLSIHPGQFIQLGSPRSEVVEASLRELAYAHRVLQLLGDNPQGVITLHVGAAHGDHHATMARFIQTFHANDWLGRFLALENDEFHFCAGQTLEVANACGIGMIFDIFHHSINPSEVCFKTIKASWGVKRPKLHISSQAPGGKRGMHADWIDPEDFESLLRFLGDDARNVDVMIEAKAKEDAIAALQSQKW